MKLLVIPIVLLFMIFSCTKNKEHNTNAYFLAEKFTDSLNIGEIGKTKVEIENFRNNLTEDNLIVLKFFKKYSFWDYNKRKSVENIWRETSRFYFDKDGVSGIDAEISDFNNDGYKDFLYVSGIAARGGNVIKTLFIYDSKNKAFVHIKNSDKYPNLSFNSKLKCINSIILTGSVTTHFLRLKQDSLIEFARVDVSDKILVEERDSSGQFKIIEERKLKRNDDDFYSGYSNYKPLEK
ncbi:XAC2610-related protein [Chryseobacterium sp. 3008163]|uniref:XAC2610-related protein n=1 Tax=Chryseobacterium sp. 3008163 TaxID=2478663 RepID=UPI000F0C70D0|nr:hypothetical protein [Chryseobacterium sp. 3008163]AYN00298.1 hypothetical protein EAG08_08185 [Chryseobacterium sp. 3008163]